MKFIAALVAAVFVPAVASGAIPSRPTALYVAAYMKAKINQRATFAGTPGLVKSITCEKTSARQWLCDVIYKNDTSGKMTTHLVAGKLTWGGN